MTKPSAPAVVFNPVTAAAEADAIRELFDEYGIAATWFETTEDDPGVGQTAVAVKGGADLVIACGGDGTVRACAETLADSDVPLAVVPAGTGNLLARNLGVPEDVAGAIRVAITGTTTTIDVGVANGEVFTVMAGAGIDASIMENTSRRAKEAVGSVAYVATAGKTLLTTEPVGARITIDGSVVAERPAQTVLVGNCGRIQGVALMPDADPADGALDLLAVSAETLRSWLAASASVLQGSDDDTITRGRGESFEISFDQPVPYEIDGEARSDVSQLEVSVRPHALTVCIEEVS